MALPAISAPRNFCMAAAIPLSTFMVGIVKTDSACDCWEIVASVAIMEIIQVSTSKQQSCETGRKLTQHVCLAMAEHNSDAVKKGRFC